MAPLTRQSSSLLAEGPRANPRQSSREDSWDFAGEEDRSEGSQDDSMEAMSFEIEQPTDSPGARGSKLAAALGLSWSQHGGPSQFLRYSASRAGREVEDFAECLDRMHPRKEHDPETLYDNAFKLVRSYQTIAQNTVKRLRKEHAPKRQRLLNERWRRRVQGINEEMLEDNDPDFEGGEDELGDDVLDSAITIMEELKRWEQEAQTWDLLALMLGLQYTKPGLDMAKEKTEKLKSIGEVTRYTSEEKIWERFMIEDDVAKERQTILSWLRRTAESSGKDIEIIVKQLEEGAERGKGLWAHGWLYTKEAVKAQKRLRTWPQVLDPSSPSIAKLHLNSSKNQQLVTQLDPDAITRQSRALESQDEYFERAIWLACWEMLRRGKSWNQVREWCRERVEGWRSVSMRGGQVAWDSVIDEKMGGALPRDTGLSGGPQDLLGAKISGNRSRALWRRTCFALARRGGVDPYERAVYGILSGDLPSVQTVCRTWDDLLFAHYNSLVVCQFDKYLQSNYPDRIPPALSNKFGLFDSVQYHGDSQNISRNLIDALGAHNISSQEAKQALKKIQGSIISRRFPEFVYRQGIAISKVANGVQRSKIIPMLRETGIPNQSPSGILAEEYIGHNNADALRVTVHALLIFQQLGFDISGSPELVATENVIVAYIQYLSSIDKLDLVPLYASRLSKLRSELTLGRMMLDVTEHSERERMVKLMQGLNINAEEVVKTQMGLLLTDLAREEDGNDAKAAGGMGDDKIIPQIVILEPSADPLQMGQQIRLDFITHELSQVESMLISSFEWFLAVEGMWFETFHTGARLYKRFLRRGRLTAARELLRRMPTSHISLEKTEHIIGTKVDISIDAEDSDDDEGTSANAGKSRAVRDHDGTLPSSPMQIREMREVLSAQATSYIELEKLVVALDTLQTWRLIVDEKIQDRVERREKLQDACHDVMAAVGPLLHEWLVCHSTVEEKVEFDEIRNMYLPEVILAYNSVLHYTGCTASREMLPQCLELSTLLAADDSDVLSCFIKAERLPELVDAFAQSSRATINVNGLKGGKTSEGKRRAGNGETLAIWRVKPFQEISQLHGW
ncbi:MAG: Nucleoporin nup84 [Geoglossum umbratile]|nr:MAG: Nucleoporin nup84 [Geoglossum umbratile]